MGAVSALRSAWNATFQPVVDAPEDPERRLAERLQAVLTAEVVIAGTAYQAQIRNISTGGLTLAFASKPALFKGAHLLVRAPGFAPISGSVRWLRDKECGMIFNVALAEDVLNDRSVLFDPGKRARPGRARVRLPATLRAPGLERRVTIQNISPGGALISSGLPLPLQPGRGFMLDIDGILPIGGHVRWSQQGRCGVMFSKLLPVASAEEIAQRCALHPSWLREVTCAHTALLKGE
jgi:hypothetical protein